MGKDYYKTLGVEKNASADDIKKAFRKKAHVYHPDKSSGDEAKFKEINEAYQVLGDANKRAQYDQFGSSFEQAQQGGYGGAGGFEGFGSGFNINMDDMGDIFGGFGDMFGFGSRGSGGQKSRRGGDIQVSLDISFKEAVFGVVKELKIRKKVVCPHCHGNQAEPGTKIETCKTCGGSGRVQRVQRTILGNMQVQTVCETCHGEGKVYTQKCTVCRGQGTVTDTVALNVKIPAGIDNGESIRLSGQGEAGEKGAPAGDLFLRVRVLNDARFERDGYDIRTNAEISFTTAVLGGKIDIETIHGPVSLKIPDGTQSGTLFKLRGKGISRLRSSGIGDHFVRVSVKTPTSLNRRQKELLKELGL